LTPALKGRLKRKRPGKSPGAPVRLGPMDSGGGGGGGGGRDSAMVATAPKPIRFSDLGGVEPAMQTIEEAVLFPLRHPEVYAWLGVEPPRGILLHGPPGCVRWRLYPRNERVECGGS
jgi:ribosome biogenesis ATPase